MRRRTFLLGTLALTACGTGDPNGDLAIAAGESGGIYLDFATLLAANAPNGLHLRPIETGGSRDNLARLQRDEVQLALTLMDSASGDIRALGRVYENYLQLVVRQDSPITSADQLAGLPVSMGNVGSGAALQGSRLELGADVRHMTLDAAANALRNKEIAALLWSGGVPTPRLAAEKDIRLVRLDAYLPRLRAAFGHVYEPVSVRAGVYGSTVEIPTIGTPNLLVCKPDLPDELAAAIVRMLVHRAARLVPDQALGTQFLDVRSLIVTGVPLHPGAAAEYRRLHG